MDDAVVEPLEGRGLDELGFRLGTPDLATSSKFMADEHQHRAHGLGDHHSTQRRCGNHRQADPDQGPSAEHDYTPHMKLANKPIWVKVSRPHRRRGRASLSCERFASPRHREFCGLFDVRSASSPAANRPRCGLMPTPWIAKRIAVTMSAASAPGIGADT